MPGIICGRRERNPRRMCRGRRKWWSIGLPCGSRSKSPNGSHYADHEGDGGAQLEATSIAGRGSAAWDDAWRRQGGRGAERGSIWSHRRRLGRRGHGASGRRRGGRDRRDRRDLDLAVRELRHRGNRCRRRWDGRHRSTGGGVALDLSYGVIASDEIRLRR